MHGRYAGRVIRFIFLILILFISTVFAQEQLNLAAIRVEFQEDQNDFTTGTGKFILDATDVLPYTIDPPPHNRSYFEDQLIAVKNYFLAASAGQLQITGQVFPRDQNMAYQLPQVMAYYSPNTTDEENDARLAELFVDAIEVADQDPDLDFSQFDLFVIFHAGVGKDIDLGFDETPQDIPSLYIAPEFLKKSLGDSFTGVPVENGTIEIDRGIILPETESQDETQVALTGIFAANIGSHLGLYDLFSPSDELPGIGSFGLMDIGFFNVVGLVPAMPSAFSQVRAGWGIPIEITEPGENFQVNRLTGSTPHEPTIYKIPINSDEYYLIEYRGNRNINIDSVFIVILNAREEVPSYLEVLQTYLPDQINISDSTGVLLKIDDYDWGLPGSGILIWHIDESVIAAKGAMNRINDDRAWRAVDLEEADGSQDIGYSFTILEPGYQSEFGTWLDFWFAGNPAPLYKNEFSSTTSPNSRSNRNYAYSHITLDNFSSNSNDIMTFSFTRDFYQSGYPLELDPLQREQKYLALASTSLNGINGRAVITAATSGEIFVITPDGNGFLDRSGFTAAVFGKQELPSIALADTNRDEQDDLIIAVGKSGRIELLSLTDADNDNLLDTLATISLTDSITTPPVVQYPYFFVGTNSNTVHRFLLNGSADTLLNFSNVVNSIVIGPDFKVTVGSSTNGVTILDLDSDGFYEIVKWDGGREITVTDTDSESERKIILPEHSNASPVFADVDQNGFYEIVFATAQKIYALTPNGTPLSNMPLTVPVTPDDFIFGSPIIADINDDGQSDIISATRTGQIYAHTISGKLINGFPFTIGGILENTVLISDVDADDKVELLALNKNGNVYAWELLSGVPAAEKGWFQSTYNSSNNRFINQRLVPVFENVPSLLPSERVFNYPNPNITDYTNIRYFLRENAKVTIKIFDVAGDLVTSFSGPGIGQSFNEICWNVAGISSGVYLCRVEAVSVNDKDVKLIKIMVVN